MGFKDDVSRQTWFNALVPVPTEVIREFVATLIVLWFLLYTLGCLPWAKAGMKTSYRPVAVLLRSMHLVLKNSITFKALKVTA